MLLYKRKDSTEPWTADGSIMITAQHEIPRSRGYEVTVVNDFVVVSVLTDYTKDTTVAKVFKKYENTWAEYAILTAEPLEVRQLNARICTDGNFVFASRCSQNSPGVVYAYDLTQMNNGIHLS